MTDYYPLITKAVAALEKNTGEQRRLLYQHAREALLNQLAKMEPPRTVAEAIGERLALEEAIRKAEAEVGRRLHRCGGLPDPTGQVDGRADLREGAPGLEYREVGLGLTKTDPPATT